ncbi:DUF3898 domain-containing protein [Cytobacillus pseudoceanisediminis]
MDHLSVSGLLSDFGETIPIAKVNGRYVLIIESESIKFEKAFPLLNF